MSSLRGYGCNGGSGYWRPPDQRRELSTGPFSWWQRQTSRPCGGLVSGGRNRWANTHAVVAVGFPTSVGKKQPVRQTGKKILSMAEGERVASILPVSEFAEDHYLLMLTVNGCIMTVPLKLFSRMHSSGIIEIQLDKESTAETKLVEAKKQYDLMLESKQLGLSRHLKELSQRNDQAINDIKRKYDVEKQEIISSEKGKVEKTIKELSTKYDKELSDCKEESKRQLLTIQEEHASLILSIREEHESKELNLKAKFDQELRQNQIQAENELKERITALKSEHDVQLKAFKCQYEDDCKKLQEELDLQRKKEEKQRALVQLQWKVMSDNPPEEQEVNSNKVRVDFIFLPLENLNTSEDKKQELSLKLSSLEMESKENCKKLQADAQRQVGELETLQKESESHQLQADLLAKEVNQLQTVIEEKGHVILQCNENEKQLNQQIMKDKELLATTETKLAEAKKQYDLMLENKQLELSRHLKELSQRNDQAINDIRRKYDVEKQEIINSEKDKVEKIIKELSTKYDKELSDCKAESKRQLLTIQEEHSSLILSIREEHESKELNLKAKYDQELRQNQIQAESELKERITALKSEHDVQLKAFKCQYEDDCKKLQEELDLQRKKEEKQRALVQLQWKVMSDNPPEEQEVNSNKVPTLSLNTKGVTAMGLKKADKMASLDTSSLRKDMVEKSEETSNEKPYKGDASLLGRLKMGVEKQLSQYEVKAEWSIVVPPGRYVSVNPGEGNLVAITEVRFNSPNRPDNDMICADGQAPHCQVYLGINRTREEFVLFYLNTVSQPRRELHVPLYLTEGFTIGHAAYSEICFSGFRYGEQPEPQPLLQPLLGEETQVSWPFDVGVTAMILSKFGGSARVARAELVCKLFYRAGRSALAYEDVDLSETPAAEDLTALMCMRRAGGQMRSLVIGCPEIRPNYLYTNRVLKPFQYLGKLLTKLAFFGLSLSTSSEDMLPVFAQCSALQDFEMKNASSWNAVPIPLVNVMQNLATHCARLERLVYDDSHGDLHMEVDDDILLQFVQNCPAVNHLGLRGVSLLDSQVQIIFEGLRRLTSLDLSSSRGFTGISLVQVANTMNDARLKVLVLQTCGDLTEEHIRTFFMRLREGSYSHLHKLLVRGRVGGNLREGFEARTGVAELVTARPGIDIDINFVVLEWLTEDTLNELMFGPDYVVDLDDLDEEDLEDLDEEDLEDLDEEEPPELEDLDEEDVVARKRFIHW